MKNILELAKERSASIIADRRKLHAIPETGTRLPKTAAYVCKRLDEMRVPYKAADGYSGIVALIGRPGKGTIGIRADMDALPIKEESGEPFSSDNGNMHACGHDAHTAILLGTAAILKSREALLPGQVKLIFQPSEEASPSGANLMINDGVMENPHVDAMLALHMDVSDVPGAKPGDLEFKYGCLNAWEDPLKVEILGKGGHGSTPDRCVDPIAIAHLVYEAMQIVCQRELNPIVASVLSFGTVSAGQGAPNVIPDKALMKCTIRSTGKDVRDRAVQRFREVSTGIAELMGGKAEFTVEEGCAAVINDDGMVDMALAAAKALFPEARVRIGRDAILGAEDAGYFFQRAPGCYFRLWAGKPYADGTIYPAHSSRFRIDDSVLYRGAAEFAQTVFDYFK